MGYHKEANKYTKTVLEELKRQGMNQPYGYDRKQRIGNFLNLEQLNGYCAMAGRFQKESVKDAGIKWHLKFCSNLKRLRYPIYYTSLDMLCENMRAGYDYWRNIYPNTVIVMLAGIKARSRRKGSKKVMDDHFVSNNHGKIQEGKASITTQTSKSIMSIL